jgi:hypothetical protein
LNNLKTELRFSAGSPTCVSCQRSNYPCPPRRRVRRKNLPAAGPDTNRSKARSSMSREAVVRKRNRSSHRLSRRFARSVASSSTSGKRNIRTLARARRSIWEDQRAERKLRNVRDARRRRAGVYTPGAASCRAHPRGGLGSRLGCGSYVASGGSRKIGSSPSFPTQFSMVIQYVACSVFGFGHWLSATCTVKFHVPGFVA